MENNIFTFTKLTNIFYYFTGLKRISVKNHKINDVGIAYKVCSFFFFFSLFICFLYVTFLNFVMSKMYSLSLVITFTLSQVSMSFIIFANLIYCVGFRADINKEMYNTLLEIDEITNFTTANQNKGIKTSIVAVMLFWFIIKSIQCLINFYTYLFYYTPYNISLCILDLQIIRLVFEINIIARRFEVLNYHLSRTYIKENDYKNFDKRDSILMRFWRITDFSEIKPNNACENLIFVCSKQVEVVNMLASHYELLVQ